MVKENSRKKYPRLIRLYDILQGLGLKPEEYNLTDDILNVTFFDCFTEYRIKKDVLVVTGLTMGVDEEVLKINLKDSTLIYESHTGDQVSIREYTSNGFDLSRINLI